ncbi:MAG: hypothetical protein H5T68_05755 [Chloroflexi bacterium]|nr:hypothetical protein [Chloroflexota bacterium]
MSTRGTLALCIILALLGWIGLASFTYYNPPDIWNRWIVVVALWPTLLTTFLPMVYMIYWRLGQQEGNMSLIARQSALAALFVTMCVALRLMQAFNWAKASLLLLLSVLVEALLSAREKEP